MANAASQRPDYERSDVDPRLLSAIALGAAIFVGATPYILSAIYPGAGPEIVHRITDLPPAPRLQVDPRADLLALRTNEQARLSSYGWADRANGVVRLPVDQAMELTAQRGLPGWPKP